VKRNSSTTALLTGRLVSFPVVVAEYEGGRYLVSMLGKDANWCSTSASPGGGRQVLTAWPAPVTAYGEFEGLRLPAGGKAVWKLPDGDLDYINVTITELHYDAGAAGPASAPAPEGGAR
jgi:hypothetical protein